MSKSRRLFQIQVRFFSIFAYQEGFSISLTMRLNFEA